ncbi:MAG: hypothetical protein M0P70_07975 [Desulfobulbaceae bacterium]|nr:hypothetical protein [Desulfobulbaceae bacterium]
MACLLIMIAVRWSDSIDIFCFKKCQGRKEPPGGSAPSAFHNTCFALAEDFFLEFIVLPHEYFVGARQ